MAFNTLLLCEQALTAKLNLHSIVLAEQFKTLIVKMQHFMSASGVHMDNPFFFETYNWAKKGIVYP
jgi:hypothetical protein